MDPKEIRLLRKKLNLTLKEFADKVGVNIMTIYRWETGRNSPTPFLEKVLKKINNESK